MRSSLKSTFRIGLAVSMMALFLLSCQLGGLLAPEDGEPTAEPVAGSGEPSAGAPEPVPATDVVEDATGPEADRTDAHPDPQTAGSTQGGAPPPSAGAETMSLVNLNTDLPDYIVEQLSFAGGGGPGGWCGATFADNNRQDTVIADGYLSIDACHWDGDQMVEMVLLSPSGEELLRRTKAASPVADTWIVNAYYVYNPLELELGKPYVLSFTSDTKSATVEIILERAPYPVKGFSGDTTVFYNFQPGETVDVYYYEGFDSGDFDDPLLQCGIAIPWGFAFKGWQTYTADASGRVSVKVSQESTSGADNDAEYYLAAIGQQSGEAVDPSDGLRELSSIVTSRSRAESDALKEACYEGHTAANALITSLGDFLGAAIESEIAAFQYSDPQLAAEYYTGEVYESIVAAIVGLDESNAYALNAFDFVNSYYENESASVKSQYSGDSGPRIVTSVWLDSCELWQSSYYAKADNQLLLEEPTRLVPQKIRIDLTPNGTWKIARVDFKDPPAFCSDIDPGLYVIP